MGDFGMLHFPGGTILPPHNLLLLSAFIKDYAEIYFIDAVALQKDAKYVLGDVCRYNPDAIFMNTSTPTAESDFLLSVKLKEHLRSKIIFMGPHAVYTADEVFQKSKADCILIDNVPEVAQKLVHMLKEEKLAFLPGAYIKVGNQIQGERLNGFGIENFPFPEWSIAPLNKYFYLYRRELPYATMVSSIGCLFRCKFCPYPVASNFRYTEMSPGRVLSEIKFLKGIGIKMILFRDALFTANKKRIESICNLLEKEKIDIIWRCETSAECVDEFLLSKMAGAGCRGINFGIESIDSRVVTGMNCEAKRKDLRKVKDVFKKCKSLGIETFAFFISGLPDDDRDTIKRNVDFAIGLEPDHLQFTYAVPFPGTELYKISLEENLLVNKLWENFSSLEPVMSTRFLTIEEVCSLNKWAYRRFFLRPRRIFKELLYPARFFRRATTYLNWLRR
jgi:radical SAM superfamily enzyme YgiQ (UPF0313 family)